MKKIFMAIALCLMCAVNCFGEKSSWNKEIVQADEFLDNKNDTIFSYNFNDFEIWYHTSSASIYIKTKSDIFDYKGDSKAIMVMVGYYDSLQNLIEKKYVEFHCYGIGDKAVSYINQYAIKDFYRFDWAEEYSVRNTFNALKLRRELSRHEIPYIRIRCSRYDSSDIDVIIPTNSIDNDYYLFDMGKYYKNMIINLVDFEKNYNQRYKKQ